MKDRLEKFMKSEGLTPSRFAEIMGVQPSSISHILGGRNKPSFDFIEKILLRFPKINPDWLIIGKGQMYRLQENEPIKNQNSQHKTENLFDNTQFNIIEDSTIAHNTKQNSILSSPEITPPQKSTPENSNNHDKERKIIQNITSQIAMNEVERVVIFFKNRTFVSYEPS